MLESAVIILSLCFVFAILAVLKKFRDHLPPRGKESWISDAVAETERNIKQSNELYGKGTVQGIADRFYREDPNQRGVYRITTPEQHPLTLLTITSDTFEAGIKPIYCPASDDYPPLCIVSVTPDEFEKIVFGQLALPNGWRLAESYNRSCLRLAETQGATGETG